MALIKMTKEDWKIEKRGSSQVREAIELNIKEIEKAYSKENISLTQIAKQLDKVYKEQFTNESIFVPSKNEKVNMKPTVKANNIKSVFKDNNIELKDSDK